MTSTTLSWCLRLDAGRRSAARLTALEVLTRLGELGRHPADVGEAMSAADPGWMARLTASVAVTEVALPAGLPAGAVPTDPGRDA